MIYLDINVLQKYTSEIVTHKDLEYSLSLVDGNNRITVLDWSGVSYASGDNFIRLDTGWLLDDNEYELSFRHTNTRNTYVTLTERRFRVKA